MVNFFDITFDELVERTVSDIIKASLTGTVDEERRALLRIDVANQLLAMYTPQEGDPIH